MESLLLDTVKTVTRVTFNIDQQTGDHPQLANFADICDLCEGIRLYRCRRCRIWVCIHCDLKNHKFPPNGPCKLQSVREMLQDTEDVVNIENSILLAKMKLKNSLNILNNSLNNDINEIKHLNDEIAKIKTKLSRRQEGIHYSNVADKSLDSLIKEINITGTNTTECLGKNMTAKEDGTKLSKNLQKLSLNNNNDINDDDYLNQIFDGSNVNAQREFYAIQITKGNRRWAKIYGTGDGVYIHSLQPGDPPNTNVPQIDFNKVQKLLGKNYNYQTFFDITWGGKEQGRVCMNVFPNYSRSANFVLMCSGEYGCSYKNTCFLWIGNQGKPGEFIEGGDYENNDGTGGSSILPIPHKETLTERSPRAGLVQCLGNYDNTGSQFYILLKDNIGITTRGVAQVTEGLDILKKASLNLDSSVVKISDCGLVVKTT